MRYQILYEEVDESNVEVLKIISPSSEGSSVDEYRYPKAGEHEFSITDLQVSRSRLAYD